MKVSLEQTVKNLHILLKDDMDSVNTGIIENMQSPVPLIPELAGHLISSGGKRIRPILTLASAKACGYENGNRHINLAQCVEFIHTATLLHDDVVDESDKRRGIETANTIWGNKSSVLVGDFLFSRAFELMVKDGSLDVLKILSSASSTIAEGEVLQLLTTRNIDTTLAEYLEVINNKTAVLFAAATQMGPLVANKLEYKEALNIYGIELGLSFQMIDDILDYKSNSITIGKNVGDDFKEGKMTLPIVIAIEKGANKSFWKKTIEKLEQEDGDFEKAIEIIENCNAFEIAEKMAKDSAQKAVNALEILPNSPYKKSLIELANNSVYRIK